VLLELEVEVVDVVGDVIVVAVVAAGTPWASKCVLFI
jgi:hypothetical protein